ncbi:MAG: M48 family metallopeptidase, partial [Oscillospiraceae bacterium]|nr:M48 family metallopeptidase [Oscillospiraceae bacterium]
MEYILIRLNRTTLSIQISKEAEVLVKAPPFLSNHFIDDFVNSKKNWIIKKQSMIKNFNDKKSKFSLNYGDKVLFRGKEYTIRCDFKNKI